MSSELLLSSFKKSAGRAEGERTQPLADEDGTPSLVVVADVDAVAHGDFGMNPLASVGSS
jgi:hypothetical protein